MTNRITQLEKKIKNLAFPKKKYSSTENNEFGYIGKPKKCKCGGTYKWYDGCLGYESLVCDKCGRDIQD